MASTSLIKALGLNTSINPLEAPEGTLLEASNVIIRRDNVIESRRGYELFGVPFGSISDRCKQMAEYKSRIIRHYSNKLQFEDTLNNDGEMNFLTFSGDYEDALPGYRFKSIESNGNFYFTSSEGIKKISAKTADDLSTSSGYITQAGGVKALDFSGRVNLIQGETGGFLPQDSTVGYKVVWGLKDANGLVILGTPSDYVNIYNFLSNYLILDFNNLLNRLDFLDQTGSLVDDGDYTQDLFLSPQTAASTDIYNNLISLSKKIDQDIVFADSLLGTLPLVISSVSVTSGIVRVSFSSGNPENYLSIGDSVLLSKFASGTTATDVNEINKVQTITNSKAAAGLVQAYVEFTPTAYGQTNPAGISGTLTNPAFTTSATSGPVTITLTCENHGLSNNQKINISGSNATTNPVRSSGNGIDGTYDVTVLTPNTFSIVLNAPPYGPYGFPLSITAGTAVFNLNVNHIANSRIESHFFRSLDTPSEPSVLATNSQLTALQTYLKSIISKLKILKSSIISSFLNQTYLSSFDVTENSNVILNVTIPSNVVKDVHFCRIYRTDIITATNEDVLSLFLPITEYRLIEEFFPTQTEINQRFLNFEDSTPQTTALVGENLYTNERSGQGALQANDLPPFATDINKFKNYTFFSNTKTRHRTTLNFLPPTNLLNSYNPSNKPKIIFTNSENNKEIYTFVKGVQQKVDIETTGGNDLLNRYFLINSANNETTYNVWYKTNGVDGSLPSVPVAPAGLINLTTSISPNQLQSGNIIQIKNSTTTPSIDGIYTIVNANVNTVQIQLPFPVTIGGTADYVASIDPSIFGNGDIPTIPVSPSTTLDLTTGYNHRLSDGMNVEIKNSTTTPSIDGVYSISNITDSTFRITIPSPITVAGSASYSAFETATSIKVVVNFSDNDAVVAEKTKNSINDQTFDFVCSNDGNDLSVLLNNYGDAEAPSTYIDPFFIVHNTRSNTSFIFNKTIPGQGENASAKEVLLSPGGGSTTLSIEETVKSLIRVINRNSSSLINAFYISTSTIGTVLFESKDLNIPKFYVMGDSSVTGETFFPSISPNFTSVVSSIGPPTTVQTQTAHGLTVGDQVVMLNSGTTPDIDGLQTVLSVPSTTSFTIGTTLTSGGINGVLGVAKLQTASDNEEQNHRIYYSKYQETEAVPILNFLDVGANDKAILRIFPLRDSLFVFKEDGLWRISGESEPFNLALFDSSCILLAADSLDVSNNQLFCWTTQGISTVTESGVNIISRSIDVDVLKIATFPNFKSSTWGVGYESDTSYTVYTTKNFNDTKATVGYRYSGLTSTWTTLDISAVCGINKSEDDRLYLGAGDINYIEKERKSFSRYDYSDRELDFSIATGAYNDSTISLPDVSDIVPGDVAVQTQYLTIYEFNSLLKKLDNDIGVPKNPGESYYSELAASAGDNLRKKIEDLANKLDSGGLGFTDYFSSINTFTNAVVSVSASSPAVVTTAAPHNLLSNRYVQISNIINQPKANGNFTITKLSATQFSIPLASKVTGIGVVGSEAITLINSFEDIKACYNIIIDKLNQDPVVAYNNYSVIDTVTEQESVVVSVNKNLKTITLNSNLDFVVGDFSIFKAIPCSILYSPNLMGDPLNFKHLREMTIMFANKAFTAASLRFSTDLLPEFIEVAFSGNGSGIFGHQPFGDNFFGGGANSAPFRTYIPRQCQRCRFINVGFDHNIAREQFSIYGMTLTGETGLSTRAYR